MLTKTSVLAAKAKFPQRSKQREGSQDSESVSSEAAPQVQPAISDQSKQNDSSTLRWASINPRNDTAGLQRSQQSSAVPPPFSETPSRPVTIHVTSSRTESSDDMSQSQQSVLSYQSSQASLGTSASHTSVDEETDTNDSETDDGRESRHERPFLYPLPNDAVPQISEGSVTPSDDITPLVSPMLTASHPHTMSNATQPTTQTASTTRLTSTDALTLRIDTVNVRQSPTSATPGSSARGSPTAHPSGLATRRMMQPPMLAMTRRTSSGTSVHGNERPSAMTPMSQRQLSVPGTPRADYSSRSPRRPLDAPMTPSEINISRRTSMAQYPKLWMTSRPPSPTPDSHRLSSDGTVVMSPFMSRVVSHAGTARASPLRTEFDVPTAKTTAETNVGTPALVASQGPISSEQLSERITRLLLPNSSQTRPAGDKLGDLFMEDDTYEPDPPSLYDDRLSQALMGQPPPRDGTEQLPPYTCSVHIEGFLPFKQELLSPVEPVHERLWERRYFILHGTALYVYDTDLSSFYKKDCALPSVWLLESATHVHVQPMNEEVHRGEVHDAHDRPAHASAWGDHLLTKNHNWPWSHHGLHLHRHPEIQNAIERFSATIEPHLVRKYSMQGAQCGLAADYTKRKHVVRIKAEGEQFLVQARNNYHLVDWIEALQASINISEDLDVRVMPKFITLPRRRRRRGSGGETAMLHTDPHEQRSNASHNSTHALSAEEVLRAEMVA